MRSIAVLFVVILSASMPMLAQNTFTGDIDDSWSVAGNWNLSHVPQQGEDVVIPADLACVLNGNTALINNLTVNAGGQLLRNSNLTVRFVNLTGNIVCDGIIGNGATYDALGLNIDGVTCSISGSGSIDVALIRKNANTNPTTTLTINKNISLRTSTTGMYNNMTGTTFNIVVASGVVVDIPFGSLSVDGLNGATGNTSGGGGTITVQGTLNVGKTLYLTTDNDNEACAILIANGGVLSCSTAVCSNSAAATHTLDINAGGELNFTSGGWGTVGATNNTYTLDGVVRFSGIGSQSVAGPNVYTDLVFSGSGVRTLSSVTVNGTFCLQGGVTVSGTPTYGASSTLKYEGSSTQTTSLANEFTGVKNLLIANPSGIALGSNVTVSGTVTFPGGSIFTGGYAVTLGANAQLSGEQIGKCVIGNVVATRNILASNAETFGNIGFELDNSDATALGAVTVTRTTGDNAVVSVGANNSIKRRFTITGGGALSRNVTFKWLQSEDNGKGPNNMGIWQNTGSDWHRIGSSETVSGNPRSLTKSITSFSGSFTATDDLNPLPIQLISFTAVLTGGGVHLVWQTLSEVNNYGFYVQRSPLSSSGFVDVEGSFTPGNGTTNVPQSYSFIDGSPLTGRSYYRLKQVDLDGEIYYSDPIQVDAPTDVKETKPFAFTLSQNYPNPFNPSTQIAFSVESIGRAVLSVHNILGQHVATLFDGMVEPGKSYAVTMAGQNLVSGTYYYILESNGHREFRSMLLLK